MALPNIRSNFEMVFILTCLMSLSQSCSLLAGALIKTNQFSQPSGASEKSTFEEILTYIVGSSIIFPSLK